jgi:formamidopyrimidine-DNA glycosylase
MAKARFAASVKPASRAKPAVDAQVQLLMTALTDVVVEMIQAKCKTITNRERQTLERRIEKAIRLFVEGRRP